MERKPNILTAFLKYNSVAIVATGIDFGIFMLLNEIFGLWYVLSTILSAIAGGIIAFILNRNWVFKSKHKQLNQQIIKYILVWGGSILLNTVGLYLLIENSNINEIISKIIVTVFIGVTYNFLMSRLYTFTKC